MMTVVSRVGRDLCLIVVGGITFVDTPQSLKEAGVYGPMSKVWALMLGLGAIASLIGVLRNCPRLEITGCAFVGGGFLVWAAAALTLPILTPTALALVFVFLSGTAGQLYRVAITSRQTDRRKP